VEKIPSVKAGMNEGTLRSPAERDEGWINPWGSTKVRGTWISSILPAEFNAPREFSNRICYHTFKYDSIRRR